MVQKEEGTNYLKQNKGKGAERRKIMYLSSGRKEDCF